MEVTRAWQVMSAIHNCIATHKDQNDDLPIKDALTFVSCFRYIRPRGR